MKVDHGRLKRMGVEKEVVKAYKRKRKGGKRKVVQVRSYERRKRKKVNKH